MKPYLKLTAFIALGFLLILISPYKLLRVTGDSMSPTLNNGDWVLVHQGAPKPNQLVAFVEPTSNYQAVKRCVALGGDEVQVVPPHLFVNKIFFVEAFGLGAFFQKDIALSGDSPIPLNGFGHKFSLEVDFELLQGETSFGLKRGGIKAFFNIKPSTKRVELFLSGGTLRKPRLLAKKNFSGRRLHLTLSLSGAQLAAEWNKQIAIKPLPFSEFPYSPEEVQFSGEFLILGSQAFTNFSLWQERNYQISGNFGVDKVFRVRRNHYFMLGDNSKSSRDSRHYGDVKDSSIIGVVVAHWGWP